MTSLRTRLARFLCSKPEPRVILCIFIFIVVTAATGVLEVICSKSSERCLSTWLHPANQDNFRVVKHEYGANASRDCFDFDTWNKTALGDTALSVSSFFFLLPVAFVHPLTTSTIAASMYIAITSFLFHATYGEVSRMYDVIGIRVASWAVATDAVSLLIGLPESKTDVIFMVFCKWAVVLIIAYVIWFQWRILTADWHDRLLSMPEFKESITSVYYNLAALPFIIYPLFRKRHELLEDRVGATTIVICSGLGAVLLWIARDADCPKYPQSISPHTIAHLLLGTSLAALSYVFLGMRGSTPKYTKLDVSEYQ